MQFYPKYNCLVHTATVCIKIEIANPTSKSRPVPAALGTLAPAAAQKLNGYEYCVTITTGD